MSDLEQRIRDALTMRAEAAPVEARDWDERTMLEEAPARQPGGLVGGSRLRGRRQVILGFASVLTAVATLAVGFGALGDDDPGVSAADQPIGKGYGGNCGGYTDARRAEEAEGLRFLPTWLPPGEKITYASARVNLLERDTCDELPTALVLIDYADTDRSRIDRAARLSGPVNGPYRLGNGPTYEPIEVRGVLGTLTRPNGPPNPADPQGVADTLGLHWTEPDGSSWELTGTLTKEEIVAMAEGFVLDATSDGPPAAAPNPPAGFEIAWQLPHRPEPLPEEEPWWVAHTNRGGDDNDQLSIVITRHAVPHPAIGAAVAGLPVEIQLLEVRGHPAVRTRRFLIWDEAPGVQVQLSGQKDLVTLVGIAESLVPVPADDPRIENP